MEHQPKAFEACLDIAKNLYKPDKKIQNIACLSIHQSEKGIPKLLNLIKKQDFDRKDLSFVLFVNGDNKKNQ